MRVAPQIKLSNEDRQVLERWARGRSTPNRLVLRARIVLAAADGKENQAIAAELGTNRPLVGKWRTRFAQSGLAGIEKDAPRGGRPATARHALAARIIQWTTQKEPKNATHWSCRTLAAELSTSHSMVNRVWKANGLKPHLTRTFKLSNDKRFVEKLVVGLYLNPPEHALVLCCDEKTQIAALNVAEGKLIGTCMPRHRHQEWIKFLMQIDQQTPAELDLHLIADNYSTHKHPKVQRWLKRHPRFHMHFIPTSSSWLNLVERWFREITDKRIRRGTFDSVAELIEAIEAYIARHNENPRSFTWTAKTEDILEKVRRARAVLDKTASA